MKPKVRIKMSTKMNNKASNMLGSRTLIAGSKELRHFTRQRISEAEEKARAGS